MKKYNIILLAVTFLTLQTAWGQFPTPMQNFPSPNVASFGAYGHVPVNHYTGQPNITIPIYELKEGQINVPIVLSYNLASVKPNTPCSWVGLGWNLTAGGYISRTVRGVMDESKCRYDGNAYGYYAHYNKVNGINSSNSLADHNQYFMKDIYNDGGYELMADEFSFDFCGYSGSFYLNPNGQWSVISDHDIKVQFSSSDDGFINFETVRARICSDINQWGDIPMYNDRFFNKFTLVTLDGIKYKFGGINATEFSISYYNRQKSQLVPTTWYLYEIETVNGDIVTLNYNENTNEIYYPYCRIDYTPSTVYLTGTECNQQPHTVGNQALSGFLIFPVYLKKIESSSITIEFNSSNGEDYRFPKTQLAFVKNSGWYDPVYGFVKGNVPGLGITVNNDFWCLLLHLLPDYDPWWTNSNNSTLYTLQNDLQTILKSRQLNGITIHPKTRTNDDFSKTFQFNYTTKGGAKRLLRTFIERDGDYDSEYEKSIKYSFQYYDTNYFPLEQIAMTDHWGYYKGGSVNYSHSAQSHSNNKSPSEANAKAHTLIKITYPTGGYTTFDYELNTYGKYVSNSFTSLETETGNGAGAGLRVKEIKSYTDTDILALRKKYYYITDTVPTGTTKSGILKAKPLYVSTFYADDPTSPPKFNWFWKEMTGPISLKLYNSGGFFAQSTNNSTPTVSYSSVIEETLDGSGNSAGYVRYTFSNYDTNLDDQNLFSTVSGNSYLNQFSSNANSRGKLKSEEFYDANNKKIRENKYRYLPCFTSILPFFKTVHQQTIIVCPATWNNMYSIVGSVFYTYTYSYLLDSISTIEYLDDNKTFSQSTKYKYNMPFNKLIISKTHWYNNEKHVNYYNYNSDLSFVFVLPYILMTNSGILNAIIGETSVKYDDGNSNGSVISSRYNQYKISNKFYPYKIWDWRELNPTSYNNFSLSSLITKDGEPSSSSNFQQEITYSQYDSKGNIREIQFRDGSSTVYLWGYNYKYPIAEIKNATLVQVTAIINETTLIDISEKVAPSSSDWTSINNLRTDSGLANAIITTFSYKPLVGMESMTDHRGITTYYEYDELGRLISEKVGERSTPTETETEKNVESYNYRYRD